MKPALTLQAEESLLDGPLPGFPVVTILLKAMLGWHAEPNERVKIGV
jgi:hypothetical protein